MFFGLSVLSPVKTVRFLHVVSCAQGTFLIVDSPRMNTFLLLQCKLGHFTAKAALTALSPSPPLSFLCFKSRDDDWRRSHDGKRGRTLSGEKERFELACSSLAAPHLQIVTKGFDGKRWWMSHWFWTRASWHRSDSRCCKCWSVDVVLSMDLFVHLKRNLLFSK